MAAPPRGETLRVQGYKELLSAISKMPKEVRKDLRGALREAGEAVRKDAQQTTAGRLASARSADGYRTVVRARGISVEQSLRKTTGNRPDWGRSQMRYSLVPSLVENEENTKRIVEYAMRDIEDFFEREARWKSIGLLK